LLVAPMKVAVLLWRLSYALFFQIPRPDAILVQNPPSIPSLILVWIAARVYGARMVVDWHNFGFTVLSYGRGGRRLFASASRIYERFFASVADSQFCVTRSMRDWMIKHWGVEPIVLYDKAPSFFHQTTVEEKHELFTRLEKHFMKARLQFEGEAAVKASPAGTTLFTTAEGKLRDDRPALLVSATSWTEDEDFGVLLDGLRKLDDRIMEEEEYPPVLIVVTGKGPLKGMYEERIHKLKLFKVCIVTMWLEPEDYPLLLGSADIGVCLHTSTSGLDLPMKVVDMFGCGLPVCAIEFDCLEELVQHGKNGMVFTLSDELADQLGSLLSGITAEGNAMLQQLREGVAGFERWQPNWARNAAPVFSDLGTARIPDSQVTFRFRVLIGILMLMFILLVAICRRLMFMAVEVVVSPR